MESLHYLSKQSGDGKRVVSRYEADYFIRRRRNSQSETTWRDDYQKVFSELPPDELLTVSLLTKVIGTKTPDTRTRRRFVDVCTRLAKFAGLEANFAGLKGTYSSDSVVRSPPSDQQIAESGKDNSALGNRVTHAMKRYELPFQPYDLRHAWAVRTIAFKVPTTLAARMMGHSVEVHEKIYQQWITEDFETQVIQKLMEGDRPLPPGSISGLC
jgi:hypothetical protein